MELSLQIYFIYFETLYELVVSFQIFMLGWSMMMDVMSPHISFQVDLLIESNDLPLLFITLWYSTSKFIFKHSSCVFKEPTPSELTTY